jgi:hypothetical protein
MSDLLEIESTVRRISGFVLRAARVADRNATRPCLDVWESRARLSRIDDAVFAGQRVLKALAA